MEGCDQECNYIRKAVFGTVSKQVWRTWLTEDYIGKIVWGQLSVYLETANSRVACLVHRLRDLETFESWDVCRNSFILFSNFTNQNWN